VSAGAKTAAGERKPPIPGWMYGIVNPVVKAIIRSPLGGKLNGVMTVVTFTGRRSGRRASTPVGYTREGNTVTLLVHRPWWKNFRGGADVSLYLDGRERPGRATAVEEPADLLSYLRRRIAELGGVKNARRTGLTELDPNVAEPTDEQLLHAARGAALVRVELA
jgi:hypothetical protein